MNNQIFFTCVLVALGWLIYKYLKDRREYTLYVIFIFASMQLHKYPFYLPTEVWLACWAFLGFAIVLYKIVYQKLDRNLVVVAVMLFTFGINFLIQGLLIRPLDEKREARMEERIAQLEHRIAEMRKRGSERETILQRTQSY